MVATSEKDGSEQSFMLATITGTNEFSYISRRARINIVPNLQLLCPHWVLSNKALYWVSKAVRVCLHSCTPY